MEYMVVIFLCGLTIFTFADSCNHTKTEGEQLEIKLANLILTDDDDLKWTKNNKIQYHKKRGNKLKLGETGSLVIPNVTLQSGGIYNVEVYKDGKQTFKSSFEVCVYEKLNKPMVNFTCDNSKIKIACNVFTKMSASYKWQKNGNEVKEEKANFEIKNQQDDPKYKCTVSNLMSKSSSDEVKVICSKPTLFGIDFWLMVTILAAGGGLVLVLTIVLMTCACYRCQHKKRQQKDEEELRLNTFPLQFDHPKSNQTARGQPAPPVPEYEVSIHQTAEDSGKRNQRYVRPPPPPVDEDEQPPPLPQPRKKVHTKNNSVTVS